MKKITSILLILILVFTLTACKKSTSLDDEAVVLDDYSDAPKTETEGVASKTEAQTVDTATGIVQSDEQIHLPNQQVHKDTVTSDVVTEPAVDTDITDDGNKDESEASDNTAILVNTTYLPYSVEQAIKRSTLIVACEYIKDVRMIRVSSDEGTKNFTDVKVKVTDILRGQTDKTEIIVRLPGGKVGGEDVTYSDVFNFKKGKKFVLFLFKPDLYSSYSTNEDYYELVHESYGGFYAHNAQSDKYFNCNGLYVTYNESGEPVESYTEFDGSKEHLEKSMHNAMFTMSSFKELMSELNKAYPINPNYEKESLTEWYNEKTEKGDITKEQADNAIANRKYAAITAQVDIQ